MSADLESQAQRAAERRIELCEAWMDLDGSEETPDEPDPSCAPYCGCTTCMVREVLDAAYPFLLQMARLEAGSPKAATDVVVHDHAVPEEKLAVDGVDPTLTNVHRLHPKGL